ncbi:hypothetical protein [Streptomyces tsukubensis]|uniref:hypothetical protein n=1 Tax=Streptomyces tsukubensis TaxID=83656 RepID=UPI00344DC21E
MSTRQENQSTTIIPEPQQCPGCPPGNSLPIAEGERMCDTHSWWSRDNGASLCLDY